jgi:hypothetical protein
MINKYIILLIGLISLVLTGCTSASVSNVDVDNVTVEYKFTEFKQFNAWNNTLTGVDGLSNVIDTYNLPHISIATSASGATTLSVYVSQDSVNFVKCEDLTTKINAPIGYESHIFFNAGARYYQLKSSNDVLINATISAKP